ncbi:MAG TPA: hypothetical protein VGD94_25165 [Vicinamibacterales bacterium]
MTYLVILIAACCFMAALRMTDVLGLTAGVLEQGRAAARILNDRTASDDQKERLLQQASLGMMRAFVSISVRAGLAFAAALVPLLLFQAAGVTDLAAAANALVTWQGMTLTAVFMTAVHFMKLPS